MKEGFRRIVVMTRQRLNSTLSLHACPTSGTEASEAPGYCTRLTRGEMLVP